MQKYDIILTILSMPPVDRIEIIDRAFNDFDSDNSNDNEALWAEESERRLEGYLNSSIEAIPAADVFNL
jgi:hypothetical protein